jgi:CheY-like chemotaxis protein
MSRRYGGTGLGLSISKQIAKLLHGDLQLVESAPDVGTQFEFSFVAKLPAQSDVFSRPRVQQQEENLLSGLSVLVVDDAQDNRELINRFLARAGANVQMAANGAEGVSIALRSHFDAILMDIQMPVLDGYEATKRLRANLYHGPIIALTAHALKAEKDRALSEGFDAYLTKPVNRAELVKTLREFQV